MDAIYIAKIAALFLGSFAVARLCFRKTENFIEGVYPYCFVLGLVIYSGIGALDPEVPEYYLFLYCIFILVFCVSYGRFFRIFERVGRRTTRILDKKSIELEGSTAALIIVVGYIGAHVVPLVYPQLKIGMLFSPPPPDLLTSFSRRFESQETDILLKFTEYSILLTTPLFYIALFEYRRSFGRVVAILGLVFYLQYVATGYKSRGELMVLLGTLFLSAWVCKPAARKFLLLGALAIAPFLLVLFNIFQYIRLGESGSGLDAVSSIGYVLDSETSLPREFGVPLIESGASADALSYFVWLITLPIPKILSGAFSIAQINYEISEVLLGVDRGRSGFYVVLPGLVAEAYYIFGKYLFWLHAVFLAAGISLLARLFAKAPALVFLNSLLVMLVMYNLNRAGVSGFVPLIVNQLILLYLFIIFKTFSFRR